ncbi:hypothetical protein [Kistimonas asteriae]|uniref:hypothetical protein n=1 Tax=Kistimonas asteriae TaxID=517724 RepID=UPI001BACF3DE|nr:hypothetical protein [Kistimonas asteriae]
MKRLILSILLIGSGVLVISFFATLTGDRDFLALFLNIPLILAAPIHLLISHGGDLPVYGLWLVVGLLMIALCCLWLGHWFYRTKWGKGLLYLGGLIWGATVYVGLYFYVELETQQGTASAWVPVIFKMIAV